eukprot:292297_1
MALTTTLNNEFNITTTVDPCDSDFEVDGVTTGMSIAIGYGVCHCVLLILLAIRIYVESRKAGQPLSLRHFAINLWKERGIYTPLLIHIYDTATDLGVLYEWYQLAEYEKTGCNLKSLDMHQFFWTALGFMIAYRSLLGLAGSGVFLYGFMENMDDICCECKLLDKLFNAWENCADKCCIFFIPMYFALFMLYLVIFLVIVSTGFVFGALELMIFLGIYVDFKEKKNSGNAKKGAGNGQKVCQCTEGVLESLPEVIMQSVFIMRALNDDTLQEVAGHLDWLIFISIIASLLSITSKYVWIDEIAVRESAKTIFPKKEDFNKAEPLLGEWRCLGSHYISYGYIIRMVWRLSAVTARFVIFALIWVTLGGAFEIIMIPIMMLVWYIAIFSIAFCGNCALITSQIKTAFKKLKRSQHILNFDEDFKQSMCGVNWYIDCVAIVMFCLAVSLVVGGILLVLFITGVVFQLGIAVITGKVIYLMRVVENCFLMLLVSVFAFVKFDCWRCADKDERHASFDEDGNHRILAWLIVGWVSVIIHMIMTIKMHQVIDEDYDMDVGTIIKEVKENLDGQYQEYLKLQQRIIRFARVRQLMRRYTEQEIANMIGNRLIPDCENCTTDHIKCKLVPRRLVAGVHCSQCEVLVNPNDDEGIDVAWYCLTTECKFHLCTDCGHIENVKDTILSTATMMRTPTTLTFSQLARPKHLDTGGVVNELAEVIEGEATQVEEKENEVLDRTAMALISGEIELGKAKSTEKETMDAEDARDDAAGAIESEKEKSTEKEIIEDVNDEPKEAEDAQAEVAGE